MRIMTKHRHIFNRNSFLKFRHKVHGYGLLITEASVETT